MSIKGALFYSIGVLFGLSAIFSPAGLPTTLPHLSGIIWFMIIDFCTVFNAYGVLEALGVFQ